MAAERYDKFGCLTNEMVDQAVNDLVAQLADREKEMSTEKGSAFGTDVVKDADGYLVEKATGEKVLLCGVPIKITDEIPSASPDAVVMAKPGTEAFKLTPAEEFALVDALPDTQKFERAMGWARCPKCRGTYLTLDGQPERKEGDRTYELTAWVTCRDGHRHKLMYVVPRTAEVAASLDGTFTLCWRS